MSDKDELFVPEVLDGGGIDPDGVDPAVRFIREATPAVRKGLRDYSSRRLLTLRDRLPAAQEAQAQALERLERAHEEVREAEREYAEAGAHLRELHRVERREERIVLEIDALNAEGK